ncbi:hypothetical protein AHiyo8_pI69900 (plasmid) [Arthrobacter sp. Hiyo8]|nr:hypothetical protein AHiyo8_pI69900 [Arthrobacter sp. Hiyo8]
MNTPQDRFALTPRRYDPDEDWFGLEANPSSTINVPSSTPTSWSRTRGRLVRHRAGQSRYRRHHPQ